MKRLLMVIAVAVALIATAEARAQSTPRPAAKQQVLSEKELQRLAREAKTPDDHATLSDYYLTSAKRHDREAAEYEALAQSYDAHKGAEQSAKRAGAATTQSAQHCRSLAVLARKAAEEDRALASIHADAAAAHPHD